MNPIETINTFYQYIIDKDADAISKSYYPSEELYVILEGPRLSNRGIENISKGWYDFCQTDLALTSIDWQEGPFLEESADMAWLGGVVKLAIEVKERAFEQIFRATFVFCRHEGKWKIKHEHVSAALEDPYGIGDWLKK